MTSFYTMKELRELGLNCYGENVCISRKASIYGAERIFIGNNVRIDDFCILSGHIEIGEYTHIAAYTALHGGKDGIYISDFVSLSSKVSVYSVNDDYSGETMTNPMIPETYKNVKSAPVYIERHTIIGSTSIVLPGVRIAEGSAFGSFSLITKNSEPWSMNVGIPSKKIGERKKDLLDLEQQFLNR